MRQKHYMVPGILVIMISLMPAVGYPSAYLGDLGTLVVTPARYKTSLRESIGNTTVLTRQELEARNIQNTGEAIRSVSGIVSYDYSGVGSQAVIDLRGFSTGGYTLVMVDGIPVNEPDSGIVDWTSIPIEIVERIEITRGPSAALYGNQAIGGVINVITREGSPELVTSITSDWGSYSYQNNAATVQGSSGNVNYFMAGARKFCQGFRENSELSAWDFNGKLSAVMNHQARANIALRYHDDYRGYPGTLSEEEWQADPTKTNTPYDGGNIERTDLNANYEWEFRDNARTNFRTFMKNHNYDSFLTGNELVSTSNSYGIGGEASTESPLFSISSQLLGGIELSRKVVNAQSFDAPAKVRGNQASNTHTVQDSLATFGQVEMQLSEPWKLVGGLRFDGLDFNFTDYNVQQKPIKRWLPQISWRSGFIYDYAEAGSLYLSVSRAFKAPTLDQLYNYPGWSNPELKPETGVNYEAGANHQLLEKIAGSISFYFMQMKDEIWTDPETWATKNLGKTNHIGSELEISGEVTDELSCKLGYAWQNAIFASGPNKDNTLTLIPENTVTLQADYMTDFGPVVGFQVDSAGKRYTDETNKHSIDGYTLVSLNLGWHWKVVELWGMVTNLFDVQYVEAGFGGAFGNLVVYPGAGRTLQAGLRFRL